MVVGAVVARRPRCAVSRSRTAPERGGCRTDLGRSARRRSGRRRVGDQAGPGALLAGHQRSGTGREEAHPGAGHRGRPGGSGAPRRDGHFWMAANMGALADAHGLRQGLKYRTPIREALETARRIDPSFLDGSPDRALGRW